MALEEDRWPEAEAFFRQGLRMDPGSARLIVDLGDNPNDYNVGDLLSFKLKYMGALRLLNSDYIEKRVV